MFFDDLSKYEIWLQDEKEIKVVSQLLELQVGCYSERRIFLKEVVVA